MHRPAPLLSAAAVRRWNVFGAVCLCWGLFTLICAAPPTAFAQYRFDQWTADTGLPQNIIRAIHQTPDGYLWLATLDGLARFDGVRFTVFNKMNSPGINSNRFISLYEDRDGALWLGTENGGVTRYLQGKFTTYTTQDGLASNLVPGICGDAEGNVLILSGDQVMRRADGQFLPVARIPTSNHLGTGVTVIERDNKGGFWGVSDQGLSRFADGRLSVWTRKDGLPSLKIQSVAADRQGALWVATQDAGLVKIESGRVTKVQAVKHEEPGRRFWFISGPEIKAFSKDDQGALWVTELDSMRRHLLTRQQPDSLATLDYYRLLEDREGNLWIGAEGGGLHRARKQVITAYSTPEGLTGRNTYPIYEDRAGAIWIGAEGLNRFSNGSITTFTSAQGLASPDISAIYEDRDGRLWVGTGGVVHVLSNGRFSIATEIDHVLGTPRFVQAIHQDREGALWFGANVGLVRYRDGVATAFTTRDGLAGDDVKVIIEGARGQLWIGSYGGLSCLEGGKFTAYTERDGLPGNSVRALYEDREGALWIGTYDGGLGRFKDGKFTRYTTREGLFNDGVFQILEDGRGWFWMSSNRGIHRVSKQELDDFAAGTLRAITSVAYGKSDGMRNAECNGGRWPAGVRARDGKLWFPTQDGAAVIDPATLTTNPQPPPVLIESFLLDRSAVAFDREVRIEPGQTNFEIQYTALSFINSEQIRFKYRLEGLEHDWVEAGTRRAAYYSHVPAGEYTFRVIAANSDGVWNEEGRILSIVVLPPFYLTWWFVTLASLCAAGLVWAAFRYRVAQLRRAQAAQEAFSRRLIASQEVERKRIAAELHDSLGQSLVIIRNWALLGSRQLDPQAPAREELDEISTTASRSITEVREIAYNLGPYHLDRLGLANTVKDMVNRVAQASKVRFTTDLEQLDGALTREAEMTLYRIAQEAINNLVKHSGATEARVEIRREAESVKLTVSDNGRGFDPQTSASSADKAGFGLTGMAERARLLNGAWAVHSAPGRGTTIVVTLGGEGRR